MTLLWWFLLGSLTAWAQTDAGNLPIQKIRPDDLVAVSVYNSPELTRSVRVSSEGNVRLPLLKHPVKAVGLLPSELEQAIAEALKQDQVLVDPVVTINIQEYAKNKPISVAGQVKNPLTFQVVGSVSLLEAITRAGGLTAEAGPDVLVSRVQMGDNNAPIALVQRIPVKSLLNSTDAELNVKLNGGEQVTVPEAGRVYVYGAVRMPGAFRVGDGTEASVIRTLALAGGLGTYWNKNAFIYRKEASGASNEIPIALKQIMEHKSPDLPLQPGDVLFVPENNGNRLAKTTLDRILGVAPAASSIIYVAR